MGGVPSGSGLYGGRSGVRDATAADLIELPALEAAADTLLTALSREMLSREGGNGALIAPGELPPPATVPEFVLARHILVAGEPPVGFARIEEVDGQAHLEQLSVHPDAAGAGLGRLLLEASLAWAVQQGYHSMTLCTFAQVPFNAPFYRRCGFEVVHEPAGDLAALREHERRLGLDAMGERVALRIELGGNRASSA